MPKVDFYHLKNADQEARDLFLCKLVEKVFLRKHHIYIHCSSEQEAQQLDEKLWTFKDTSFIPHHIITEHNTATVPVQLGCDARPTHRDILINLTNTAADFHHEFTRILEITAEETSPLQNFYEKNHYEISHHVI